MGQIRTAASILALIFIAVAIGAHATGTQWLNDFGGDVAYFALIVAVAASIARLPRTPPSG